MNTLVEQSEQCTPFMSVLVKLSKILGLFGFHFSVEFAVKYSEGNFLFTVSAVLNSIVQILAYL